MAVCFIRIGMVRLAISKILAFHNFHCPIASCLSAIQTNKAKHVVLDLYIHLRY